MSSSAVSYRPRVAAEGILTVSYLPLNHACFLLSTNLNDMCRLSATVFSLLSIQICGEEHGVLSGFFTASLPAHSWEPPPPPPSPVRRLMLLTNRTEERDRLNAESSGSLARGKRQPTHGQ